MLTWIIVSMLRFSVLNRFTPETLIQILESKNIDLGLIIDLTFTTRYYNAARFTGREILYEKIFVPGHIIPDDDIINR